MKHFLHVKHKRSEFNCKKLKISKIQTKVKKRIIGIPYGVSAVY